MGKEDKINRIVRKITQQLIFLPEEKQAVTISLGLYKDTIEVFVRRVSPEVDGWYLSQSDLHKLQAIAGREHAYCYVCDFGFVIAFHKIHLR